MFLVALFPVCLSVRTLSCPGSCCGLFRACFRTQRNIKTCLNPIEVSVNVAIWRTDFCSWCLEAQRHLNGLFLQISKLISPLPHVLQELGCGPIPRVPRDLGYSLCSLAM
uniref:Secreted protein n=1 Tax=Physcomitrium patens TaxID=3218 RepID=A0A2K1KZX5_PHYPA|nr:hypothetical protein PHYPA_002126 [Physcomitrium patens]